MIGFFSEYSESYTVFLTSVENSCIKHFLAIIIIFID